MLSVIKEITVIGKKDPSASQGAFLIDRRIQIDFASIIIPRSRTYRCQEPQFIGGALLYKIDNTAQRLSVGYPLQNGSRPSEDLHLVIKDKSNCCDRARELYDGSPSFITLML